MRILVVDFNFLGDMILDSCIFPELAKLGTVDVMVWSEGQEAVALNPYVNIRYVVKRGFISELFALTSVYDDYDIVISLHTSFRISLSMWLSGMKHRAGYSYKGTGFLNSVKVPIRYRTLTNQYRGDEVMYLIGVIFGNKIRWERTQAVTQWENESSYEDQCVIGIHMSAKEDRRNWGRWASLISLLQKDGCEIVIFGAGADRDTAQLVIDSLEDKNVRNTCGEYKFMDTWQEIAKLNLMVCVNSSLMHVASACDTPVVALIDKKSEVVVKPKKSNFYSISAEDVKTIRVGDVYELIRKALE